MGAHLESTSAVLPIYSIRLFHLGSTIVSIPPPFLTLWYLSIVTVYSRNITLFLDPIALKVLLPMLCGSRVLQRYLLQSIDDLVSGANFFIQSYVVRMTL
jgi:hypothetical protein